MRRNKPFKALLIHLLSISMLFGPMPLLSAEADYDYAYTYIFSPREGTEAALMVDQFCDPAEVGDRFERLRVVVERSALAKHLARIGRTETIMVEGPSKRDPEVLTGRTEQNKLVHFNTDRPLRAGTLATNAVATRQRSGELEQSFTGFES